MGAAAGCLLLIPAAERLRRRQRGASPRPFCSPPPPPSGTAWPVPSRGRVGCVALALALVAFLILQHQPSPHRHHATPRGHKLENEIFVKWNSFSRIAVTGRRKARHADRHRRRRRHRHRHFRFRPAHRRRAPRPADQGAGLPYALRPGAKALIIGPGGGWDVARALASGSHDITGVEINPIIATTIMRERLPRPQPRPLPAARRPHRRRGRPQLRAAQRGEVPGDAGDPGRYVGVHRRRRIRAFGKQSLHRGRFPRLPATPHRRRRDGLHALGLRSAARIAAPDRRWPWRR